MEEWREIGSTDGRLTFKSRKSGGYFLFHLLVLFFSQAWVEWVAFQGTSASDTGGNYKFTSGIEIAENADITPVLGWMLVGLFESTMVVFNDGVKQVSEDGVRFSIRCVDSYSGIMVFQTWKENTCKRINRLKQGVLFDYGWITTVMLKN